MKFPKETHDVGLPIYQLRSAIEAALQRSNRLILQAPTGSGKSTQVPQFIVDSGLATGRVVVLQPRRLAARMLASRVAAERGSLLGGEIGYQIRLDNVSSAATRVLFVTEGILLRQMLTDPLLTGISAILFDEFHERHLFGDLTLAQSLELQEKQRPDLKLLLMSATLDGADLYEYLAPCELLRSEGRTFPVEIAYKNAEGQPVWEAAAEEVARKFPQMDGNALVFMPGAYEIARTVQAIRARLHTAVPILPLHGELPPREQDAAVESGDCRKVIVSTNVAETSLTIEGVTLVVDSGLARIAKYDPHRGINTLLIEKISRSSADQRAGRAGRTAPGVCIRLWKEKDHARRPAHQLPEVLRMDLAETLLALKAVGVRDFNTFRWIDPPERAVLERASDLLKALGAIEAGTEEITPMGRRMLAFPMHPRYARMFIAAATLGCVRAIALIAALTQSRNLLLKTDRRIEKEREDLFGSDFSDFSVCMRAYAWAKKQGFRTDACRRLALHAESAREVDKLFKQFLQIANAQNLKEDAQPAEDESIAKCILVGFSDQLGCRRSMGTLVCDLVHGRRGMLSRTSAAQSSRLLVAAEINEIDSRPGDPQVLLSLATTVREEWLQELFPADFRETTAVLFDSSQNRVVVQRSKLFRDLTIESQKRDAEPSLAASQCLAEEVLKGELKLANWGESVEQRISRVNRLSQWMPELKLPPIGNLERHLLITQICENATCYRDIKDRPVLEIVRSWLSPHQQQQVERYAPERWELPGGRKAKIVYDAVADPLISARIQDLYGVESVLQIADGRVALTFQILAPNHRPVQVTKDLGTFWKETYPNLKKQLQRQYPKHVWK
ncbi:MAG: ATP-dependent helicase HrpB [Verrucomicrobia bacterium]|nr:MAG: ATP-dependent helicase HrpB [Verrucomicrobiota bacterium]